jgi:predicted TIM-barrel fold metal-dependent hydrolase
MQGFGAIARLVGEVGADRILLGTGAMLHYPACNVAKLDGAELSPQAREAILWRNAKTLLQR